MLLRYSYQIAGSACDRLYQSN